MKDDKLDYFKRKILEHLMGLEEDRKDLKKSLLQAESFAKGGKGLPIGTIREWKGKKYIKIAPGKWRPKYDSNSRGAKLSIAALKRKAENCMSSEELLDLVLENRDRFSDKNGRPLPFVKELSDYVSQLNDKIESRKKVNTKDVKAEKNGSGKNGDASSDLTKEQKELIDFLKFKSVDMPEELDFTKENYDRLFSKGVDSPIEKVTLGENQFRKLQKKNRKDLLAPILETLKNPNVIGQTKNGEKLYVKTFNKNNKVKNIMSVVIDRGNMHISISTHEERLNQIAKKIARILYKNPGNNEVKTSHDGTVRKEPVADNADTQQVQNEQGVNPSSSPDDSSISQNEDLSNGNEYENRSKAMLGNQNAKKLKTSTKEEFKQFLNDAINTSENRRISLGPVISEAKERIKNKTGKNVNRIILDSGEIRHVMAKPNHYLKLSDLEKIADIVNNTNNITKEPKKHENNDVIRFVEEVENGINLIMQFRARKGDLSLVTAYRQRADTSMPKDLEQTSETLHTSNPIISQNEDLSRNTGISDIRKKYESSRSAIGRKKTVTLPDGRKIKCHYKIVEADAPTASHDETTFTPTQGFPTTGDGKSVNDRDYQNDKDAQESVLRIAAGFNSLALDSPPIVTKDGIVISGNNRTMSSKLAAKNGTDKAYLEDLRDMIDEYGLEESDLTGFKNPRLILEVDEEHKGPYMTEEFAQFNQNTKKTMNNVEKAVKLTKTLNEQKIQSIASELSEYDTMGELYANAKSCQRFVSKLIAAEIIGENEKAQYCKSDGTLNDTGKDFVETVLVGSVLNEDNIRKLDSAGGKRIRQKIVRAILPLIENKGNGREYSFNKELNDAVEIAVTVAKEREKYPTVETYLAQGTLFNEKKPDEITSKLAILIHDEGEKAFSLRMKNMGAGLQNSADGEMDIFLGGVESKENLMKRFLDIKKSIQNFLTAIVQKEQTTKEFIERVLSEIA